MKKSNILSGPWVIMVILPWLFPIVFVALLIVAAIKESIEPLRKAHYWFFFQPHWPCRVCWDRFLGW